MGKRILRTVLVLGTLLPLVGNALACDKDHSAKADQHKSAKTASQTTNAHKTTQPNG